MDFKKMATSILEQVGGEENIVQVMHCFTRLRFKLKKNSVVNNDAVLNIEGVIGAQFQNEQYQIIVGNEVSYVYAELMKMLSLDSNEVVETEKVSGVDFIFDLLAGVFAPILAAITGGGMFKALIAILELLEVINPEMGIHQILTMIGDAPFYFLPILLAVSAARKFKVNEYIAITLAGILVYPAFIGQFVMGESVTIDFIGSISVPVVNYSGSVIPIVAGTFLLSIVYRFVDKYVPNVLKLVLTPMISLLITAPIVLIAIGPLGNYIGIFLEQGMAWLFANTGPLAGMVIGGLMPLVVMTGMHFAFFPTAIANIGKMGYDNTFMPFCLISNISQSAAVFAVAFKSKNKKTKSLALSSGVSALFGVTEPAMFGITLKYKRPLYAAMIGGAVGGGVAAMLSVKMFGFSLPGLTSLPLFIDKSGGNNFIYMLISLGVAFVLTFVLTLVFGFKEELLEESEKMIAIEKNFDVFAPVAGKVVALDKVNDGVFSKEMVGRGVAIQPSDNLIYAPFDGEITAVMDKSKHAIGLRSTSGIELLIHVGLETVQLDGKHFKCSVKINQQVKRGDVLFEADLEHLKADGIDIITPIVVTNSNDFLDIIYFKDEEVKKDNVLFTLIK